MELIIKPTEKCNFKCTFCSSPKLTQDSKKLLSLDKVFSFLKRFPNTNTIIVNGGDPLMVDPQYYWKILDYFAEHNLTTTLSFTSNLWAFYKNPKTWIQLFQHKQVGICTSFNYGNTRKVTDSLVYTEDLFWKVSDLFLNEVGYRPNFISVISDENEEQAIDNVYLAKEMNVECKLNYAMASGRQSKPYLKGKIYKTYIDIIKKGLHPWEYNSKQILLKQSSLSTTCPLNTECDSTIRCLQPEGDYYSCGSFGDDKEFPISFEAEVMQNNFFTPLRNEMDLLSMKSDCFACPLFSICNGCKKTVRDVKNHDMVEEHCSLMQNNMADLVELMSGKNKTFNQSDILL